MAYKSKDTTIKRQIIKLVAMPIMTGVIILFSGILAAAYLVQSGKIAVDKAEGISNMIVFLSTLGALLAAQLIGNKRLYSIGFGIKAMFLLYLVADILLLGGVSSKIWMRLLMMVLSGAIFVVGGLLKGNKRYHRKGVPR